MFETIKGKLQAVQQDITAGLFSSPCENQFVNGNAGAEILHRYEQCWHHIHLLTDENVQKADDASAELHRLCNNVAHQTDDFNKLNKEISYLPKLSDELSNLVAETAKLDGLCDEVESALCYLEILCQTQDMEHVQLEQRFQLALYREKKLAALNDAKNQMSLDCTKRKEDKVKQRHNQYLEKQKVLQKAVDKDLRIYKTTGCITNSLIDADDDVTHSAPLDNHCNEVEQAEVFEDHEMSSTSVADLLSNSHVVTRKAMQLTYVDDHQYNSDNNNSDNENNLNFSMEAYMPQPADRDLSALEEFLDGIKLDDSGIVGDNNEEV